MYGWANWPGKAIASLIYFVIKTVEMDASFEVKRDNSVPEIGELMKCETIKYSN